MPRGLPQEHPTPYGELTSNQRGEAYFVFGG
jgi:hypothetical protein